MATREDLMARLRVLRPKETVAACRAVASDLYYSGEFKEVSEIDGEGEILEKLFSSYSHKVSAKDNKVLAEDPASCPLCKMRLSPVKLSQNCTAVWCSRHFVVYPYQE